MDFNVSNDLNRKARDLARKITVAHDLDPEIQEELYGHIEDKLLAYKSGEAPLTEDDKVILAQHRLGGSDCTSPPVAISLPPDLRIGWFRQVFILALATTCAIIAAQLLVDTYRWCLPWREFESDILRFQARSGAELLWWVAAPVFLLLILRRWSSGLREGARPWFAQVSPVYLAAMTLVLIVAGDAIPKILIPLDGRGLNVEIEWAKHSNMLTSFLTRGALCLIWMTWAYSLSRNVLRAAAIGMAWVLFYHLASILPGSIALLAENSNQRLYAPHWLGQIAWRQLRPDRLPEHLAMYFAIVAVCALSILLATRDWRGIGIAQRNLRRPQKGGSNVLAINDGCGDEAPPSDEEALVLVREHFGDAEELRAKFQRVHLGVARALPMRRILALAIATLALCFIADIAGGAMRLAAAVAVTSDVVQKGNGLQIAVGLFEFPLVCMGLLCLLLPWNRVRRGRSAPWFQRWSLRRMAVVAAALFALQLVTPTAVVVPLYAFGGTHHVQLFKVLMIPVLFMLWLWWAGGANGSLGRIAMIGGSFAPILMIVLLQPLKLFVLMPKVWVVDEGPYWVYLKGGRLGRLYLDWYFAPGWELNFFQTMNFYFLCVIATGLLVGVVQFGREASFVRPFTTPSNTPPTIR